MNRHKLSVVELLKQKFYVGPLVGLIMHGNSNNEECEVTPQSIPEFPLRHSSKFNKIKIHTHTHTHTLFFYTLCLLYFYKVIILALIL